MSIAHVVTGRIALTVSDAHCFVSNVNVFSALAQATAGLLSDVDALAGSVDLSDSAGFLTFALTVLWTVCKQD